jgi:hypothetical protein
VYNEYCYSELVMGGIKGKPRNNVLSFREINARIQNNGQPGCYRNHFRFTEDYQQYAKRNHSVKGYSGPAYVDFLWVDIDNKDDLMVAVETAQTYINRLLHVYAIAPEHLRCYFSGSKGFHIGIPSAVFGLTPSVELPAICKELAAQLAGDLDIDFSIYDRVRLLRLTDTQHEVSQLYKVELEPGEILNCENESSIHILAATPRKLEREYDPEDAEGVLAHLLKSIDIDSPAQEQPRERKQGELWVTDMLENGSGTGGRVNAVVRLSGYYKSINMPEDVALASIEAWDLAKNDPPLSTDPDEVGELERTVRNIYAMPSDAEDTEQVPSVIQYQNWASIHPLAPEYVEKFSKNRIKFGYDKIDEKSALLGRGETAILLAYVGVGKTVLAQNIQLTVSENQGIPSALFSLEMSAMRLYFRQLGMVWGMSSKQVEYEFSIGNGSDLKRGMERYSNMYIVDHAPLSVPLIADCIRKAPDDIGFVVVDYVGLLSDDGSNNYERMNNLSRDLVLMAKALDIAVLAIYQTNRTGINGEIHLGMGRDSGMIEANCDIALGFWPDENDSSQRHLKVLKARHGMAGAKEVLGFSGESPRLYSMERSEE